MKRITAAGLVLMLCASFVWSGSMEDALFAIDIPVTYGEQQFRQRIIERTGSQRPAVGLVLSGGSARAFAHLGVLDYLEEHDIVADYIISNSMGSIVGLLYGAGLSPDQIYRLLTDYGEGSLFRFVMPLKGGVLDASGFMNLIALVAGIQRLEELPIPVMVTGEDLVTKRTMRMAEGDLLEVMQASFALPFYFAPVEYRGHLIVDGGFTNLVPLGTAAEFGDQLLVSTTFYQNPDLDLRNPLTALNVAVDISKTRRGIEELKRYEHLLIRCDVEHFSFMDFERIDEIREAGYRSAARQLDPDMIIGASLMGISDEVVQLREAYEVRLDAVPSRQRTDGTVPDRFGTLQLAPKLETPGAPLRRSYLHDELTFSLELRGSKDYLRGGISAGGLWEGSSNRIFPAAAVQGDVFIPPGIELYGRAGITGRSELYLAGYAEGVWQAAQGLDLSSGGGIEAVWQDLGFDRSAVTLWTGASAELMQGVRISGETGGQLREYSHWHLFGRADARLSHPGGLSAEYQLLARTMLGSGSLPLYYGEYVHERDTEGIDRYSLHTARMGYTFPGLRPTWGELLLFSDIYAGVYGEAGLFGGFAPAAGVTLGARMSFIGLEELSLFTDIGYDFDQEQPAVRLYVRP